MILGALLGCAPHASSLVQAQEAPQPANPTYLLLRGAVSGVRQRIHFAVEVNPDCSVDGIPALHVEVAPLHGRLEMVAAGSFSYSPQGSQEYACNMRKSPGTIVFYTSDSGFQGVDQAVVSVIYPNGQRHILRFVVTVESPNSVSVRRDGWQRV